MENEKLFTPEQSKLAADAASPAALMALAKEHGIELTAEQAAVYYARLHPENGALSDEELEKVAGGGYSYNCPKCGGVIILRHPGINKMCCPWCRKKIVIGQ